MRSPAPALVLLAVLGAAACTAEPPPPLSASTPSGPCAAERTQPPEGSQEQRLQGDLDGDGRTDEVVSWIRDGERVVQAWLATGQNAVPEALFGGDLLEAVDVDGDKRAEVFAAADADTGSAFVLDGCRLVPVRVSGTERVWEFVIGPGAALLCRPGSVVEEAVTQGPETVRRAWQMSSGTVLGADPIGSGPVTEPGISCG